MKKQKQSRRGRRPGDPDGRGPGRPSPRGGRVQRDEGARRRLQQGLRPEEEQVEEGKRRGRVGRGEGVVGNGLRPRADAVFSTGEESREIQAPHGIPVVHAREI